MKGKQILREVGIALIAWGLFAAALLWAGVAKEFTYAMF
jgi:hypothetical protein